MIAGAAFDVKTCPAGQRTTTGEQRGKGEDTHSVEEHCAEKKTERKKRHGGPQG